MDAAITKDSKRVIDHVVMVLSSAKRFVFMVTCNECHCYAPFRSCVRNPRWLPHRFLVLVCFAFLLLCCVCVCFVFISFNFSVLRGTFISSLRPFFLVLVVFVFRCFSFYVLFPSFFLSPAICPACWRVYVGIFVSRTLACHCIA